MSGFDVDAAGIAGAALAVAAFASRLRGGTGREPALVVVVAVGAAAAVAATLAGQAAVLVAAWLAVAVAARMLEERTSRAAAFAFLGDATAIAGFAALGVDQATGTLPWAGGPAPEVWTVGMVAAGLALRVSFGPAVSPAPLVVGLAVAVRLTPTVPGTLEWLLVLAGLAVVGCWITRPVSLGGVGALALLGLAAWGPDHVAAGGPAALLLAAAAALAVAQAFGAPVETRSVAAGVVAVAATVGLVALPVGEQPAAAALVVAALAVAGATLAARPLPPAGNGSPARAGSETQSIAVVGISVAYAAAATAVLLPDVWWAVVGPRGGGDVVGDSIHDALVRGRTGLAAALGLGAVVAGGVLGGARWRSARS